MNIGDTVIYYYKDSKTDEYTKKLTRQYLTEGNCYTIRAIRDFGVSSVHYKLIGKEAGYYWYPAECFVSYNRHTIANKYNLK